VYPKKYPYPIPEKLGSGTGIYPIPNTRAKYPTFRVWVFGVKRANLGVFLGLNDPNSVHTHTRYPRILARRRVFTRYFIPVKFSQWVCSIRYPTPILMLRAQKEWAEPRKKAFGAMLVITQIYVAYVPIWYM